MKGCFDEMTSNARLRSQSACMVNRSPDYLVTTMKLRERVQSARCGDQHKVYRKTIRSLRSAPPFQNRNLDNYPMPYNREDAVRSAKGHRTQKRDSARRMVQARTDSGLMRDYSKQMFDFTVKNVNNPNLTRSLKENNVHLDRRSKYVNENVISTNGPTPDGSMLHNRRPRVLNSIRVRPHPDFESRFHHDRSNSGLSLQHTISDKNRHYRVLSRADSALGDASLDGSDFVFIPVDQISETNGLLNGAQTNFRRETVDTVISNYTDDDSLDAVFGKDPFDDVDERSSSISGHTKPMNQSCRLSHSSLLPPDISCNLRLVSLEEESSSESEVEKEQPPPEVKKPDPPSPVKTTGRGKKQVKIVIEEEKKPPEPEPIPEPVKVKLVLKGPHCWVDDATVTSDEEADGNPEGATCNIEIEQQQQQQQDSNAEKVNNLQKADGKPRSALKNATAANVKQTVNTAVNQINTLAMKDAFEKAVQNVQSKPVDITENKDNTNSPNPTEVVKVVTEDAKETEPEIVLPSFLCPSSEKKSREAALKDWLAHTCFHSGYRGLPIV